MAKIENDTNKDKVKNSIVLSGLVGTAGLFIAKLLGLLYSIPLSWILGSEALMGYYGSSFNIYSYVLNVFTAGIPFAISTIVAKYTILGDNKSLISIRKISLQLLAVMGFFGMVTLVLLSGAIGGIVAPGKDSYIMTNCLRLLSIAMFFVPLLSAFRGFWQGRKEMGEYALTQVFEQLIRVGFLLSAAYLIVYVFNGQRTYVLYTSVLSTGIAAVAAIIQIYFFDRKNMKEITEKAATQKTLAVANKELLRELVILAIPYLLTAIIGYCDQIYYAILLPIGLRYHGYNKDTYDVIISAFNYVGGKLTSIPQILAPGFIAALIPHVTEAMTQKDYKRVSKIIVECIGIVCFIGSVVSLCIAVYSSDIYNILFYTGNPSLASEVIKWVALDGFMGTLCPVTNMLCLSAGMKKQVVRRQIYDALIRGILMVPLTYWIGYQGAILASLAGASFVVTLNLYSMQKQFGINLKHMGIQIGKIIAALAVMTIVSYGLRRIGLDGSFGRKLPAFGLFAVNAILSLIVYFAVSEWMKIPEDLFHRNFISMIKDRFKRKAS